MTYPFDAEPVCARCGYRFNPTKPDKQVLVMPYTDGRLYIACADCLYAIGAARSEPERLRIIAECRVRRKE